MDRSRISEGLSELGPCTTAELTRHLCGDNPSTTDAANLRVKLYRMQHSGEISRSDGRWSI